MLNRIRLRRTNGWLSAGEFLGQRVMEALQKGDWRGADYIKNGDGQGGREIESDIIVDLCFGKLKARGRRQIWRINPWVDDPYELIHPPLNHEYLLLPVEPIPKSFWKDYVFASGSGESHFEFVENSVRCYDEWWEEVELMDPTQPPERRGRPARYDWAKVQAWLAERLMDEGGIGPDFTQARLCQEASQWMQDNNMGDPSASTLADQVRKAVAAHKRGKTKT